MPQAEAVHLIGERKMRKRTFMAGVAAATLAATSAFGDGHAPVKVGFIFVGPIGDGGWTFEHNKGRLAVEAEFGDKVETVFQESVPEGYRFSPGSM